MILGALLFLAVFGWYLGHIVPGAYFGDCGEILSAVLAGGIPHPTGFPAYLAFATLFATFGGTPFWVHVLSASSAALSVLFVGRVAVKLSGERWVGIVASLLLFGSCTLIVHASTARVYSLNLALLLALVLLSIRMETDRPRALLFGLLTGVGLGTHVMFAAALLFALVLNWRRKGDFGRLTLWMVSGFMLSLSLYLWLPLRSHTGPAVDWGSPSHFGPLMDYLTQRRYQGKMFARGIPGTVLFVKNALDFLGREWPVTHWLLAVFGGVVVWRSHRPLFRACAVVVLFNFFLMAAYGVEKDLLIAYRYFLPTCAVASVLGALGLKDLVLRRATVPAALRWGIPVLLLLAALWSAYPWRNLPRSLDCHDYALDTMKTCVRGSAIQMTGDNQVFPFTYAYRALRLRPDLLPDEWEGTLFPKVIRALQKDPTLTRAKAEEALFHEGGDVLYLPEERKVSDPLVCEQVGLGYRMTTRDRRRTLDEPPHLQGFFRMRSALPHPPDREGEEIWSHVHLACARDAYNRGDREEAMDRLAETRREGSHVPYALINSSALYSLLNEDTHAEATLRRLLILQPNHPEAHLNLGILCGKMGRYPEALKELDRALTLSPGHPVALNFRTKVMGLMNASKGPR